MSKLSSRRAGGSLNWRKAGARIALVGLLGFGSVTCSSSGGSGGGGPTAPRNANMQGAWSGTLTITSASGDTCVSDLLQQLIGFTLDVAWGVTQNGAQVEVTLQDEDFRVGLEGTVSGNTFSLSLASGQEAEPETVECSDGTLRVVTLRAATASGTIAGNQINGTYTEDYDVTDINGNPVGTLRVTYSISASR